MAIAEDPAFEQFISDHRWAVLTTLRRNGGPVSSVVAYARDGDTLVVSTPGTTFKRRTLERDPRVNLCVISNQEPIQFAAIEGTASIEHDDLVRKTRLVFDNIAAAGYSEPADFENWLEKQQRVILRIHPGHVAGRVPS